MLAKGKPSSMLSCAGACLLRTLSTLIGWLETWEARASASSGKTFYAWTAKHQRRWIIGELWLTFHSEQVSVGGLPACLFRQFGVGFQSFGLKEIESFSAEKYKKVEQKCIVSFKFKVYSHVCIFCLYIYNLYLFILTVKLLFYHWSYYKLYFQSYHTCTNPWAVTTSTLLSPHN